MVNAKMHRAIRRTPHELDVIDFIDGFQVRLRLAIFQMASFSYDTGKTNRKGNANLRQGLVNAVTAEVVLAQGT